MLRFPEAASLDEFPFIVLVNAYCISEHFPIETGYGAAPLSYYLTIVRWQIVKAIH